MCCLPLSGLLHRFLHHRVADQRETQSPSAGLLNVCASSQFLTCLSDCILGSALRLIAACFPSAHQKQGIGWLVHAASSGAFLGFWLLLMGCLVLPCLQKLLLGGPCLPFAKIHANFAMLWQGSCRFLLLQGLSQSHTYGILSQAAHVCLFPRIIAKLWQGLCSADAARKTVAGVCPPLLCWVT